MLFIMFDQVLAKGGVQTGKIIGDDVPEESVVIVVDCVRSNRNDITCLFWSCSRVEMLAAKADFPTPGDPLIQIILWPPVFLTSVSIACRMSLQMPSIHGSHILSLFPPRVLTKSSSSFCSATAATMAADTMNQTTWTMNIGTETRPCSTRISIRRSRSNIFAKSSSLSRNSIALSF